MNQTIYFFFKWNIDGKYYTISVFNSLTGVIDKTTFDHNPSMSEINALIKKYPSNVMLKPLP